MKQNKIKKDLETPAVISPVVLAMGAAAVAGAGYLIWTNRSKIKTFFKEKNLGESFGHLGGKVGELFGNAKSEVTGLISQSDNKPTTSKLHYASDPKTHAAK